MEPVPYLTERLQGFGTTIFTAMSALAIETQSVNLGQGFPDTDGPVAVSQAAIDAIKAGHNQVSAFAGYLSRCAPQLPSIGSGSVARDSTQPAKC